MTTQINQLTELTTTSDDDLILIREDSTGIDKKMKAQNIRAKATTKDDVGLGNVTNDAQFKLADAGTMATQNANDVAVTGGSINGTTVGATTASTGAFTTASASTSVTTPLITRAGNIELSATGANLLDFKTNGQDRMRITSAGNVGIGTTAPSAMLQVAGDARINGAQIIRDTLSAGQTLNFTLLDGDNRIIIPTAFGSGTYTINMVPRSDRLSAYVGKAKVIAISHAGGEVGATRARVFDLFASAEGATRNNGTFTNTEVFTDNKSPSTGASTANVEITTSFAIVNGQVTFSLAVTTSGVASASGSNYIQINLSGVVR